MPIQFMEMAEAVRHDRRYLSKVDCSRHISWKNPLQQEQLLVEGTKHAGGPT